MSIHSYASIAKENSKVDLAFIAMRMVKDFGFEGDGSIATGTVKKFLKENTLLAQAFVKDSSKNVDQVLKSYNSELTVTDFKRVALG